MHACAVARRCVGARGYGTAAAAEAEAATIIPRLSETRRALRQWLSDTHNQREKEYSFLYLDSSRPFSRRPDRTACSVYFIRGNMLRTANSELRHTRTILTRSHEFLLGSLSLPFSLSLGISRWLARISCHKRCDVL